MSHKISEYRKHYDLINSIGWNDWVIRTRCRFIDSLLGAEFHIGPDLKSSPKVLTNRSPRNSVFCRMSGFGNGKFGAPNFCFHRFEVWELCWPQILYILITINFEWSSTNSHINYVVSIQFWRSEQHTAHNIAMSCGGKLNADHNCSNTFDRRSIFRFMFSFGLVRLRIK